MQTKGFRFWRAKEFVIFVVLVIICAIVTIVNPVFIHPSNLMDILLTNTVLGMMALGMLVVILTGGIDVSVGAIIATVTMIVGNFLAHVSGNLLLAFLVGAGSGAALGLMNGLLIAKLKIHAIVVTLGTMSIIYGVMFLLTGGEWVTQEHIPEGFKSFGRIVFGHVKTTSGGTTGLPVQFLFLVAAVMVTWALLRYTMFGRGVYALGGNRISAERAGFRIDRIIVLVYLFEGILIGFAGVVHTSIMRQVDPNAFNGFELQVIAAVVLGGTSILGGTGSVLGAILGVALIAVLNNGLILMRVSSYWQQIVIGLVIVAAVSTDIVQKQRAEARKTRVDVEITEGARS